MKRFSQRAGYHAMTELNVTPLLDLAFVLLIIFIITTPLMEQSLEVTLPTASSGTATGTSETANIKSITVDRTGRIAVDGKIFTAPDLRAQLIAWKQSDPNVSVVVRADRAAEYQKLVDVFDALTQARISRLGLLTNPEH